MTINVLLAIMLVVSFLIAIVLHEIAHALMASWLGDQTPRAEGRLTLRLPEHIDPMGLLMCIVLAFQTVPLQVGLGWGKPVKPDPMRMRVGPNTGLLIVALAGPVFSLVIGLLVGVLIHFSLFPLIDHGVLLQRVVQFLVVFACTNIGLAIFNLIPLYPLDGYQIVYALLPNRQAAQFSRSAPYGPFVILIIFFFLPFLAQIARIPPNPIFEPAAYILLGAQELLGLFAPGQDGFQTISLFYSL
jgi:Zn-dependent protease